MKNKLEPCSLSTFCSNSKLLPSSLNRQTPMAIKRSYMCRHQDCCYHRQIACGLFTQTQRKVLPSIGQNIVVTTFFSARRLCFQSKLLTVMEITDVQKIKNINWPIPIFLKNGSTFLRSSGLSCSVIGGQLFDHQQQKEPTIKSQLQPPMLLLLQWQHS